MIVTSDAMSKEEISSPARRGRPSGSTKALPASARTAKYRMKLSADGKRQVNVYLSEAALQRLDELVRLKGGSRSDVLEGLLMADVISVP